MKSVEQLGILVDASYPILYVVSHEEDRVEAALRQIVEDRDKQSGGNTAFMVWSITKGTQCPGMNIHHPDHKDPLSVLNFIEKFPQSAVFVLRDFGFFLHEGPAYTVHRMLKDLVRHFAKNRLQSSIVIIDSSVELPDRVEKFITVVDFDFPDRQELEGRLLPMVERTDIRPDELEEVLWKGSECAAGLTLLEAENAFAKSLVMIGKIDPSIIIQDKKNIIRKSGVLEYYDLTTDMSDVGGLENLKQWLDARGRAFSEEAKKYGLPTPKGVLIVGVPGTGKSLTAKAIGHRWNMPVLRMDVGALFGSLVGQSEANMRKALKTAEAMAPCVLWIDEIEKAMGGGGGTLDGGTTSRVFGNFLSWMQDKQAPVFVVATANDVSSLPPEMLRKGRFDELFFSDLPTEQERHDILRIHLNKFGRKPDRFDVVKVANQALDFSGAEMAQIVVDSLYRAFQQGREPTTDDLLESVRRTTPLSKTMPERIQALRAWAKGRAVAANQSADQQEQDLPSRRVIQARA